MSRVIGIIVLLLIVGVFVWYGFNRADEDTTLNEPVLSVAAFNETKNTEATQATAQPQDTIVYTLKAENPTAETIPGYVMQVDISNLASNATLIDAGGASYNSATNSLVWTPLDINPNQSIESKFVVRVNDLPQGSDNATMTIRFNNEVIVSVAKTAVVSGSDTNGNSAGVNREPYAAPTTGPSEMLILALALASTIGVFVVRKSYQASKI